MPGMDSSRSRCFRCSHEIDGGALQSRLGGSFDVADEGGRSARLTYYDTFDWRLYHAGLTLHLEQSPRRRGRLWCTARGNGNTTGEEVDSVPSFAEQLPPDPCGIACNRLRVSSSPSCSRTLAAILFAANSSALCAPSMNSDVASAAR